MSIKGADSSKGTLTAKAEFKVLESVYDPDAEEAADITPTVAEQFQAELEGVMDTIASAIQAASDAAASEYSAEGSAASAAASSTAAAASAKEAHDYAEQASAVTGMYRITDAEIDEICV